MEVTEEMLYEWIETEDIEAMKKWLEKTDNVDFVYEYEVDRDYDEDDYYTEIRWSRPALYLAVYKQKTHMVKLLLEHGANPNFKNDTNGVVLYTAVEKQHVDIVALLLSFGADVSLVGPYKKTPLMCAVSDQSNANYTEQHQYNLLDPAKKEIKTQIIKLLLKAGADPHEKVAGFPLSPYEISA